MYFQAGTVNITWDGFSAPGKQAPDGFYCFRITAYEETPAEPALVCTGDLFPLDSTPPEITLQATGYYLSPAEASSTGIRDALELIFSCNEPVTAECMLKSPAALPGSYIATAIYPVLKAGAEATFSWDGRYADGTYAPDDTYKVSIKVTDLYGNITAKGWPVVVDNNRQADTDRGVYLLQGEKIKVNTHTLIVKDKPCVAVGKNRSFRLPCGSRGQQPPLAAETADSLFTAPAPKVASRRGYRTHAPQGNRTYVMGAQPLSPSARCTGQTKAKV